VTRVIGALGGVIPADEVFAPDRLGEA